jgi:hypothetical protein
MNPFGSDVFAALALVVSLVAFWNSYLARRHAQINDLDKQRRASLMKVRELHHFCHRVEKSAPAVVKGSLLHWLSQVRPDFEASHKHVVKMRQDLERGFEEVTMEEANRYMREFEGMTASLSSTRTELIRRLNLLLDDAL